ncbi:hypothetical protein HK105_205886 [Polyrhizophydium stewartii]|uniref:Ankyrin repeat protein n=1 Tax=Polyrhizophydium stewartii TaxID=2732419 RepID=A0ABR4N4X6_9FUNG
MRTRRDLGDLLLALPAELRHDVFGHAGSLTQYLHGLQPQPLSLRQLSLIWADCFAMDLVELVQRLPHHGVVLDEASFVMLHSERMREAVAALAAAGTSVARASSGSGGAVRAGHAGVGMRPPPPLGFSRSTQTGIAIGDMLARTWGGEPVRLIERATAAAPAAAHEMLRVALSRRARPAVSPTLLLGIAAGIGHVASIEAALAAGRADEPAACGAAGPVGSRISEEAVCGAAELAAEHGHAAAVKTLCRHLTLLQPSIANAVRNGSVDIVEYLGTHYPDAAARTCPVEDAVRLGRNRALIWLLEHTNLLRQRAVCGMLQGLCVRHGNLEMLEYALSHGNLGAQFLDDSLARAAEAGSLDALKWVHRHRPDVRWDAAVMDRAAASGQLAVVRWLARERPEGCTAAAMTEAIRSGHLGVVAFLHGEYGQSCVHGAVDTAAVNGHDGVLRFLLRRGQVCSLSAYAWAASGGHLGVIQALFEFTPRVDWSPARECAARK